MDPIVTPAQMRQIDADATEPTGVLIERAGAAVARAAIEMLGGTYGRRVAVIVGKGNNGADGLVAARRLQRRGIGVTVFAAENLPERISGVDLVIDAAYGTGFRGEFHAPLTLAEVLAVDIPSGIDGLTGVVSGRVLSADRTVTFAALKPGLLLGDGAQLCGEVVVADIGLDVSAARAGRVTSEDAGAWFPPRSVDAHKWRAAVRVIAGSPGMTGAASLACTAALKTGAGIVVASSIGAMPGQLATEVVTRDLTQSCWVDQVLVDLERFGCLLIGPGLGTDSSEQVAELLDQLTIPAVVDADALRALGDCVKLAEKQILATPHDGEFRAVTAMDVAPDRFAAVRAGVEALGVPMLLKGPTTLVCGRDGFIFAIDNGDQRLATAGSGDVLAGCIAALAAQGLPLERAGALGAFIHGASLTDLPSHGVTASDVALGLSRAIESLVLLG